MNLHFPRLPASKIALNMAQNSGGPSGSQPWVAKWGPKREPRVYYADFSWLPLPGFPAVVSGGLGLEDIPEFAPSDGPSSFRERA